MHCKSYPDSPALRHLKFHSMDVLKLFQAASLPGTARSLTSPHFPF
jgi:hypothetical protein